MRTFNLLSGVSLAVLTSVAALNPAKADTFNWDWTTVDTSNTTQNLGNQMSLTNNGQTLSAEAFQVTGNGTAISGTKNTNTLSTARLFSYGAFAGLGVTNTFE